MRRIMVFFLIILFSSVDLFAQTTSSDTIRKVVVGNGVVPVRNTNKADSVFTKPDKEASFPGGAVAWQQFLGKNLKSNIAQKNKAPKGRYQVIARFIVGVEGEIEFVQCETQHGYGMEEEVIRVIKKSPRWEPAFIKDKPVNAYRRQPITFIVEY